MRPGPLPRPGLRLSGVFVLVVAVGLAIGWLVGSTNATVAEVGSPAPDFTVELIEGETFTLSETRGRPVVLNFWASWCNPCREEIPDISAYAESHPDVSVIGVAVTDIEEDSRAFAEEIGAGYPLALGTPEVEDAYPIFGLPNTVIIDEAGLITHIYEGIVDENVLIDLVG